MRLRYFKLTDTLDELKKRRNTLVKSHHPDINKSSDATIIMQAINIEYEYVLNNRKEEPQKEPSRNNEFLKKRAQSIFYALTNVNGVNANLLCQILSTVPDNEYKELAAVYFKEYRVGLVDHISKQMKNKNAKEIVVLTIKAATGELNCWELYQYFKNCL